MQHSQLRGAGGLNDTAKSPAAALAGVKRPADTDSEAEPSQKRAKSVSETCPVCQQPATHDAKECPDVVAADIRSLAGIIIRLQEAGTDEAVVNDLRRMGRHMRRRRDAEAARVGRLPRSALRPSDIVDASMFAPPYKLHQDLEGTYSLNDPNLPFRVDRNVITILNTDSNPGNKLPGPRSSKSGADAFIHSRVIPFPEGDESHKNWRRTIGDLIAAVMFGKIKHDDPVTPSFILADFPKHMKFYMLEKTWSDQPNVCHRNVYLRNDPSTTFESPFEFARHAMWLMDGKPEVDGESTCLCRYCARVVDTKTGKRRMRAKQSPISIDLYRLAGWPLPANFEKVMNGNADE